MAVDGLQEATEAFLIIYLEGIRVVLQYLRIFADKTFHVQTANVKLFMLSD